MRNLKRVLSLTLASVMLLGMMVIGSSAAAYPDVDENDNIEAIEVLQAIEVMIGDDNGEFRPESPVTRAEMMVIVAKLLNLDYDYYAASCPFTDVPEWARGYVGAAYANKIAAGRGNGIFDPNSTVTPVEASAFLMRVLGYFQYDSDYADGFETATVRQGSKIRIYDGINSSASAPMTRNQVAQMTLNALEADVVDAEDNTLHITTGEGAGNINITGGQINYVVRVSNASFAQAIDTDESSGYGVDGRQGYIVQLGEQLYNGDLKRTVGTPDAFGAPATRWVYKNNEIGTYADEADLSYIKDVKLSDIYKDLGLSTKITDVTLVEDGDDDTPQFANDGKTALDLTSSNEGKVGHKGSLTRVYLVDDDEVKISVVNYYLAEATEDYDSANEEVDVEVKGDVTLDSGSDTLKLDDFANITSVREGDYLVVTVADGEIMSVGFPEVVSDVTVSAARSGDYVTAGGTKYEYNDKAKGYTDAVGYEFMDTPANYSLNDKGYNLYLDPCGYVLGVESVDGSANVGDYVFIKETSNVGFDVVAKAVFADGTSETITVTKLDSKTAVYETPQTNETTIEKEKFYTFKTTSSGKYELTSVQDKDDIKDESKPRQGSVDDARLDDKAQPIRNSDNTAAEVTYSANDRTVFIAKDKAYVGVKNAPETAASTVYYVLDKNSRLLIVYTGEKGSNSANPEDIVYILHGTPAVTKSGDDTYYEYTAVVDGDKTSSFATENNSWDVGLYVIENYTNDRADGKIKVDENNVTEGLAIYAGVVDGDNGSTAISNGTLTLDYGDDNGASYLVKSGAKIRTIQSTTVNNISASGVKNAVKDGYREIYLIETSSSDSDIGTIYLVKSNADPYNPNGEAGGPEETEPKKDGSVEDVDGQIKDQLEEADEEKAVQIVVDATEDEDGAVELPSDTIKDLVEKNKTRGEGKKLSLVIETKDGEIELDDDALEAIAAALEEAEDGAEIEIVLETKALTEEEIEGLEDALKDIEADENGKILAFEIDLKVLIGGEESEPLSEEALNDTELSIPYTFKGLTAGTTYTVVYIKGETAETVEASKTANDDGEITVTLKHLSKYALVPTASASNPPVVTTTYTVTVPETLSAEVEGGGNPAWTITFSTDEEGGKYEKGATVTLTATLTADEEFEDTTVVVTFKAEDLTEAIGPLAFTEAGAQSVTFTMPGKDVTITAEAEESEDSLAEAGGAAATYEDIGITEKSEGDTTTWTIDTEALEAALAKVEYDSEKKTFTAKTGEGNDQDQEDGDEDGEKLAELFNSMIGGTSADDQPQSDKLWVGIKINLPDGVTYDGKDNFKWEVTDGTNKGQKQSGWSNHGTGEDGKEYLILWMDVVEIGDDGSLEVSAEEQEDTMTIWHKGESDSDWTVIGVLKIVVTKEAGED